MTVLSKTKLVSAIVFEIDNESPTAIHLNSERVVCVIVDEGDGKPTARKWVRHFEKNARRVVARGDGDVMQVSPVQVEVARKRFVDGVHHGEAPELDVAGIYSGRLCTHVRGHLKNKSGCFQRST